MIRQERAQALNGLARFAETTEQILGEEIALLRSERGGEYSWKELARALGITPVAAQKRFAKYDMTPAPSTRYRGRS